MKVHLQKEKFLSAEGDDWLARNREKFREERPELALLLPYLEKGKNVLEIGCSSGRASAIFTATGANYCGIDPSAKAIEEARQAYPNSRFVRGTADALPFEDEEFDLVVFGFCFYVIDRPLLARTVSEADRVLRDRGFLGILDFDTPIPYRRKYAHVEGLSAFKMDYARPFLAFPQYSLAEKSAFSAELTTAEGFEARVQDRVSLQVLYKNLSEGYVDA